MQNLLIDFIPVLLFLAAFKLYGIYVATAVGIIVTALQVVVTRIVRKRFDKQQLVTLAVFAIFGGMTLYFHNPIFVKWKPSIVFWVFGVAFFLSQFIGGKPIIQRMLEGLMDGKIATTVPSQFWKKLNLAWALFFITLGTANLYVAYSFTTETWVNFKVYGILGLLIAFSFIQAMCLSRYMTDPKQVKR
jgi:intracellular septation protein